MQVLKQRLTHFSRGAKPIWPFGGVGEEGGKSSKYASYELAEPETSGTDYR